MSNLLEQDVKEYVNEKIKNNQSFTAWNITDGMKAAKHRYIKPIVRELFDNGEMKGYVVEPDNSINGSPLRYSDSQKATMPVTPTLKNVGIQAVTKQDTVSLNENGKRLRLHKSIVNEAGFKKGDKVYVTYTVNHLMFTKLQPPAQFESVEVRVDTKNNIRVNLGKLKGRITDYSASVAKGGIAVTVDN